MREEIRQAICSLPEESPLRLFVDDELAFYKRFFNQFTSHVIREKKILEFETPNRMRVVYEFDVRDLTKATPHLFVFLPDTRKNWLKVMWEGRRLAVSSNEDISDALFQIVEEDLLEVKSRLGYLETSYKLWKEDVWGGDDHIPCFVGDSFINNDIENGQLVVEFIDSFDVTAPMGCRCGLFDEREYNYNYALEAGNSHWLYVKAPKKFQVELKARDNSARYIRGNDPEIQASRIFPSGDKDKVAFEIRIKVPKTLKLWYQMIVYLGWVFILSFIVLSIIFIAKSKSLAPAFAQVGISLVAAIIATRGWIMNDETVLKRVSNIMTWTAITILVSIIILYSVSSFMLPKA